jgi:outer membrane receptor protein involved in Fe transport
LALVLLTQCADALSSDEALLDEIVIVAGRRAVDTKDVAAAVSSVGRDAVTQQKIVTDALQSLVGVVVQQTTPGQGAAIIRGLKGSAILHLVDGMRLSNAMFRTAPTPWFALVPASSVERIEVLRGTPASLYGSEAVGGVVDSVSRLPVFNTDDLSWARNVVATFDSAELQRSIRATVDGGTHRLATSVSAEYLETGNRRTGSGERIAPSGYSAKAVRAVLSATPDSNDSWYIDLHYLEQPETPRIDELIPGFGQTEPSSDEFVFAPNRRIFAHAHRRHLSATDIEWQLDAAWQRIDDDRTTRDFGSEERLFEENRSDLYGITLNAARDSGAFNWIAGADLYYDEVSSTRSAQDINSESSRTLTPRFPDGSTISHAGLFVNSSVDINERHTVLFGLRYTDVSIDLPDGTKIDPGRMSGDLGWIFQVSEEVAFVANLGAGFRAPNIADLGTLGNRPGNRFNIPNTALGAESATHGDLGLRFRGDRWRAEVVAFAMRYTDRIVSISTGTATPDGRDIVQSVNAASSDLYGVEAGARLNLGERADVRLALNYTRGDQEVAGISEPADRVPPLNGRLEIGYALADHWYLKATLVGAARQDRLSSRDVSDARIDPDGTPGWTIAGVRASWASESGWETTLGVDNLLDKRYRVHGSGLDAPGRNLFLTVRRDW